MPPETAFIKSLRESAKKLDPNAFVLKTNDSVSIGVPDLIVIIGGITYWLECKATSFFDKAKGRALDCPEKVLSHPFTGPQIGMMRQICAAGGNAMGVIRTWPGVGYIVAPRDIPAGGNFTYKQLKDNAVMVQKENHIWRIPEWAKSLSCKS